jgi:hypothetical protein
MRVGHGRAQTTGIHYDIKLLAEMLNPSDAEPDRATLEL